MEERESTELKSVGLSDWAKKRAVVREGERYKYLPRSQRSYKSRHYRGLSVAMPLFGCGTVTPSQIVGNGRVLSWLSWLSF
jgi:hypothetical protein